MSKFLTINEKDLVKGFIMAVLGAMLTTIYTILTSGRDITSESLKVIVLAGTVSGLAYIIKNLFTNNEGQILTPDPQE